MVSAKIKTHMITMDDATRANFFWFGRKDAFNYLKVDQENQIRIEKALNLLTKEIKQRKDSPKLLDLGCGSAEISKKLLQLGFEVYGIDLVPSLVKKAVKIGVRASVGNVGKSFPFNNSFFDYVLATEIIEHLFDTKNFLLEINRVLKKDGGVLLTTPNLAHFPDRIKFLFGNAPAQALPLHEFLRLHIRMFTYSSLREALEKTGFNIKTHESTMVVFSRNQADQNKVQIGTKLLAELFPTWGSSIIVYAIKK